MISSPMLAENAALDRLTFPVLATPKIDGLRCYVSAGVARTRSGRRVQNQFVADWIESNCPDGLDGELTVRGGSLLQTVRAIGSRDGRPDFLFHVFDYVVDLAAPYAERVRELAGLRLNLDHLVKLLPARIENAQRLVAFERHCAAEGHEGVMLRDPAGCYTCGRSKGGALVRLKRYRDAEGLAVAFVESSEVPGTCGALRVRTAANIEHTVSVPAGVGAFVWRHRETMMGEPVTFRAEPDEPLPVFAGFRPRWDLENA